MLTTMIIISFCAIISTFFIFLTIEKLMGYKGSCSGIICIKSKIVNRALDFFILSMLLSAISFVGYVAYRIFSQGVIHYF